MPIDYKSSGVNLDAADNSLTRIKALVKTTRTSQVVGDVGLFAGAFRLPEGKAHPILMASTDGVGTKLRVAMMAGKYDTVGEDLVNHCVNDLLANGAEPLFFMDYYGCGRLDPEVQEEVIKGLVRGCRNNGVALLGGETAEMPGFYGDDEFDLVGSIVGWSSEEDMILGKDIKPGDVILGLPGNGLHTNGYSLARKVIFEHAGLKVDQFVDELGGTMGDALLAVHPSYLEVVRAIRKEVTIKGIGHITGGGIEGNLNRVLPEGCKLKIDYGSWDVPPIFNLIQKLGPVDPQEMKRVFNLGVGMAMVLDKAEALQIRDKVFAGYRLFNVGEIHKS
ncbi:MAG: phosphoribosylformylglycinamidine cyclo-ligase [bacterium]